MQINVSRVRTIAAGCALILAAIGLTACGKMTPEEMLNQGHTMMQSRDLFGAEMQFQKILSQYPESKEAVTARMDLITCFRASQDIDSAMQQADKLLEIFGGPQTPNGFGVFMTKLRMELDRKEYQKGLDMALATSATLHGAPLALQSQLTMAIGSLYLQTNQRDKAKELAGRLMDLDASDPNLHGQALQLLTLAYDQPADQEKRLEIYRDYLKRFPASPIHDDVEFVTGQQLKSMGRNDEANAVFEAVETTITARLAQAKGDDKVGLTLKFAGMEQARGEAEKARKLYESVVTEFPDHPGAAQAELALADLDASAGDRENAIGRLRKIITEHPNTQASQQAMQMVQAIAQAAQTSGTLKQAKPTTGTQTQGAATSATQSQPLAKGTPAASSASTSASTSAAAAASPAK